MHTPETSKTESLKQTNFLKLHGILSKCFSLLPRRSRNKHLSTIFSQICRQIKQRSSNLLLSAMTVAAARLRVATHLRHWALAPRRLRRRASAVAAVHSSLLSARPRSPPPPAGHSGNGCIAIYLDMAPPNPLELQEDVQLAELVKNCVANMASYAISSSLILVIHDNMIIGTNPIVLACLCRHF
jgi:hypothetical protein